MPAERGRALSDDGDDDDDEHTDRKQCGQRAQGFHEPVHDATAPESPAGSEADLWDGAAHQADFIRIGSKRLTIT